MAVDGSRISAIEDMSSYMSAKEDVIFDTHPHSGHYAKESTVVIAMKIQRHSYFKMAVLYRDGLTLQEVGDRFGVSRERVRQIIRGKYGLGQKLNGRSARAYRRRYDVRKRQDELMLAKYGCTKDQHEELIEIGRAMMINGATFDQTPTRAWQAQRQNARARNIAWQISLWDWWMVWKCSGKWAERGRGTGYMMCRFGDEGPYSLDNVYIATGAHNASLRKYLRDKAQKQGANPC